VILGILGAMVVAAGVVASVLVANGSLDFGDLTGHRPGSAKPAASAKPKPR
jgi:hypothetical protein